MPSWVLQDVEEIAELNPTRVFVPEREERRAQQVGDEVRLHFHLVAPEPGKPSAERMWVRIESREGDSFTGAVVNSPLLIEDLKQGDRVAFGLQHIGQVRIRPGHPRWAPDGALGATVSLAALLPNTQARWMQRDAPTCAEDSGWFLLEGSESEAFLQDPENTRVCTISWLIDRDPSLAAVFRGEHGDAAARESAEGPWRAES